MGLADLVSKYENSDLVSDQASAFIGEASRAVRQDNMVGVADLGTQKGWESSLARGVAREVPSSLTGRIRLPVLVPI